MNPGAETVGLVAPRTGCVRTASAAAAFRQRLDAPSAASVFVALNAVLFYVLHPGVPDLWAARARASGVEHGVGLTYWFSWFGGSTPGRYSVLTPFLCASLGTELVAALAATSLSVLIVPLVRTTRRPRAACWTAAFAIVSNLWCGRVPFLLGGALAAGALVAVSRRHVLSSAVLTTVAVLASPVSGALLGLGLVGMLRGTDTRRFRSAVFAVVGAAAITLGTLGLLFGAPGPEPFPAYLWVEIVVELALMGFAVPRGHLRLTVAMALLAVIVVYAVPNGMGSNIARFSLFCLPVAVVATSRRDNRVLALLIAPTFVLGALSSYSAFVSATKPASTAGYYAPLVAELDHLPLADEQRLEIVGADHAANAVLLDHAILARGWETQTDRERNGVLFHESLGPSEYRRWLDDNAVGLVAVSAQGKADPERRVVSGSRPDYLKQIWSSGQWQLYEVSRPTPVVAAPAQLLSTTQSTMQLSAPCACTVLVRVTWSPYLTAHASLPNGTPDRLEDTYRATLHPAPGGWTSLTTTRAGSYVLTGGA